ncbi:MAG: type II toxin-antitoxin system Phd/YefM family antitoxin [Planctomycetota bacterium]
MIRVNTHEAKTKLSKLLAKIEQQRETVVICRNGKPVAELIPWKTAKDPLRQDAKLRKVKFREDAALPLDEDEWPEDLR